jgi:glycosyltransferase involved in cell wall biosynthesis
VYEGLGGALLEAMALAVPIVASALPAIEETAPHEEVALLVPPADPTALGQALDRLLTEPGLATQLGSAGRQRFGDRYTADRMGAATAQLYRDLVEGDAEGSSPGSEPTGTDGA